jgi:hypothetical protein
MSKQNIHSKVNCVIGSRPEEIKKASVTLANHSSFDRSETLTAYYHQLLRYVQEKISPQAYWSNAC